MSEIFLCGQKTSLFCSVSPPLPVSHCDCGEKMSFLKYQGDKCGRGRHVWGEPTCSVLISQQHDPQQNTTQKQLLHIGKQSHISVCIHHKTSVYSEWDNDDSPSRQKTCIHCKTGMFLTALAFFFANFPCFMKLQTIQVHLWGKCSSLPGHCNKKQVKTVHNVLYCCFTSLTVKFHYLNVIITSYIKD